MQIAPVFSFVCLLVIAASASPTPSKTNHWAVIVAGSNGYLNYRHQADACHAYQIVRRHGIPEDHIITMMYDDIAHNEQNPQQGVIINRPNGTNVYKGVKIDYRQEDVTPDNFIKVLLGDAELAAQGKKVLKSGPNDRVFVNFVDHGGPGVIAFPNELLHARRLVSTIKKMHSQRRFSQLLFYLEACESGSMFKDLLPDSINVYATTAANAHESSYACYFDKKLGTFLGDLYSVNWMEDTDKENVNQETIEKQFKIVRQRTNKSHVLEFGNKTIAMTEPIGDFLGNVNVPPMDGPLPQITDAVRQEDVPITTLVNILHQTTDKTVRDRLVNKVKELVNRNTTVKATINHIISKVTKSEPKLLKAVEGRNQLKAYDCYEPVVDTLHIKCFNMGQEDFALPLLYKFVNLCEAGVPTSLIIKAIHESC